MDDSYSQEAFEKEVKAHAILVSTGFLIFLPLGVLLARYARSFTSRWFYGHLTFQLFLAGPFIIAGFALGVHATYMQAEVGLTRHLDDHHKKTGVALFILYFLQVLFGVFSHRVKRPSFRFLLNRTAHQWVHVALGLTIIWLAFYQVHYGYKIEYPSYVSEYIIPSSVDRAWKAWIAIITLTYFIGLALLPRQIAQEAEAWEGK